MKSLIIGITGCSGSYLAENLLEKGHEVSGTKKETDTTDNIWHLMGKVKLFDIELNDKESIIKALKQSNPDYIYFLAAAHQFNKPGYVYRTNVEGAINFFESLIKFPGKPRILLTSSSAVYGVKQDINPLNEKNELRPITHYGLSKVFQEKIADYYYRNYNLDVIIARPFNFTGPRENPLLVCTDFARQIVEIENGRKEPVIRVGNLENIRDITDVRDMVAGFELLANSGVKGEVFNLCSGKTYSIKWILEKLLSMSKINIKIQVDPSKIRERTINFHVGDNYKMSSLTGWKPQISLDKTLEDILEYNRNIKNP